MTFKPFIIKILNEKEFWQLYNSLCCSGMGSSEYRLWRELEKHREKILNEIKD